MSSQPQAKTVSYAPLWQRWLPRVGATAAAFTTLCCIGVSAALLPPIGQNQPLTIG